MSPVAEQFVNVEQAANALVAELECLKAETQHYSAAAASLELAGQRLGSLAVEATSLSSRAGETMAVLKEIGTPQLLSGLEALTARYTEHADRLVALDQLIRDATKQTSEASNSIQALVKDLRQGNSETGNSLKQILTRLDHVGTTSIATEQKCSQAISKLESLGSALSAVDARVDAARTALSQLQGQSDKINSAVGTVAARLESFATTTDQQLKAVAAEGLRLFQFARLAFVAAGAGLAVSLVTLIYLLATHR
jgi:chromosome segregation ATPase